MWRLLNQIHRLESCFHSVRSPPGLCCLAVLPVLFYTWSSGNSDALNRRYNRNRSTVIQQRRAGAGSELKTAFQTANWLGTWTVSRKHKPTTQRTLKISTGITVFETMVIKTNWHDWKLRNSLFRETLILETIDLNLILEYFQQFLEISHNIFWFSTFFGAK